MNFKDIADFGAALLTQVADRIEAAGLPRPHVYRWWEPGMTLPAAFMWIGTQNPTQAIDHCTVKDTVRLNLSFMLRPAAHQGEDMLNVEPIVDIALPVIDWQLLEMSSQPQIKSRVNREGFRVASDRPGNDSTELCLTVEIPLIIPWNQHIEEPTP